jgi:hypothetical protein
MASGTVYMGLTVPIAGGSGAGDLGPGYAQNISADLYLIDAHDHSSGKGTQVQPAGLNISSDLTFNQHNATNLRSTRFTSQPTAINGSGDVSALYVKNGDLWYVNGLSQQVQITSAAAVRPSLTDLIAVGSSGAQCVASGAAGANIAALIPWNQQIAQSGNVAQSTGQGTGSAYFIANFGGVYQISYNLGAVGSGTSLVGTPTGPNAFVFQTINATGGVGQGTVIPQSVAALATPAQPSGILPISRSYLVTLASGVNVETWLQIQANAANAQGVMLQPTGAQFSMWRVA